jgi:hypothetical protein
MYIGALCAAAAAGDLETVKLFTELGMDVSCFVFFLVCFCQIDSLAFLHTKHR